MQTNAVCGYYGIYRKMIAYTLLLLAATPLLALPVTENIQQQPVQQTPVQEPVEQHPQFPNLLSSVYPVSEYFSPKGKSAVIQVPIEPDALVIPYTNRYSFYPTVATRTPAQTQYPANQYQYSYTPQPFLVVPIPNIPRSHLQYTPDVYNYYQAPRLLYYLPKSYYNQQQQQQYPTQVPVQQVQQVQPQQVQQAAEKTVQQQVNQVVPQEGIVPVETPESHQIQTQ